MPTLGLDGRACLVSRCVNGLLVVESTGPSPLQYHSPRILVGYPGRKDRGTFVRALRLLGRGLESGPDGIRFRRYTGLG